MFNHENTDVRYEGEYLENNIHKKQTPEVNESDESDGDSIEHEEEDFDYPAQILE